MQARHRRNLKRQVMYPSTPAVVRHRILSHIALKLSHWLVQLETGESSSPSKYFMSVLGRFCQPTVTLTLKHIAFHYHCDKLTFMD